MSNSEFQSIAYAVEDSVASLTLNRPSKKNAIDLTMRNEIASAIGRVRQDRSIRALVLAGAGGAFCAGGDIGSMQDGDASAEGARNRMLDVQLWFEQLLTLDRPVIAAVDGIAFGAGAGLALAADIVLATPRTRFCMSFARMGLVPDCGLFYTLPRVVGLQRAKELVFSAREVDAQEAQAIGIVSEILAPDRLAGRARSMAAAFRHASPAAISLAKRGLAASLDSDLRTMLEMEANAQGVARSTDYHRDAVRRFLDKSPLAFQWPPAAR